MPIARRESESGRVGPKNNVLKKLVSERRDAKATLHGDKHFFSVRHRRWRHCLMIALLVISYRDLT